MAQVETVRERCVQGLLPAEEELASKAKAHAEHEVCKHAPPPSFSAFTACSIVPMVPPPPFGTAVEDASPLLLFVQLWNRPHLILLFSCVQVLLLFEERALTRLQFWEALKAGTLPAHMSSLNALMESGAIERATSHLAALLAKRQLPLPPGEAPKLQVSKLT